MNKRNQATNILISLADGIRDDVIPVDYVRGKYFKSFYNYTSLLYSYGLAEPIKDNKKDKRTITKLRVTDRGRNVLIQKNSHSDTIKISAPDVLTLQKITEYVDEFNKQNPGWHFDLVPKRVKKGGNRLFE